MKFINCLLILMFVLSCNGKDLLEDMQAVVPVYKSGQIIQAQELPEQNMSIMQYVLNATEATEESVIDFYKDCFRKMGWKLQEMKHYAGNGSVFSFSNDESETVTIQTITNDIKEQGKLKIVINMSH